jgi:nitrite reductase/ring-hydroxylating ferredoxin subunit
MAASAPLVQVALYERVIAASLERIWENVLDWEHLPWLHRTSFLDVRLQSRDPEGWRALVALAPGGAEADIDVRLDRLQLRYLTRTCGGFGAGTEILTRLEPLSPHRTQIAVEFAVPGVAAAYADAMGAAYVEVYTRLWNEDEAMMVRRQALLDTGDVVDIPSEPSTGDRWRPEPHPLGPVAELRRRLPVVVAAYGRSYRVVEVNGSIIAHTTVCPHLGGPLAGVAIEDGCITCPWHGYRFDVRTGSNVDGRRCRLSPAPRVEIDEATGEAFLAWAGPA